MQGYSALAGAEGTTLPYIPITEEQAKVEM
jgi:hypothetical protein